MYGLPLNALSSRHKQQLHAVAGGLIHAGVIVQVVWLWKTAITHRAGRGRCSSETPTGPTATGSACRGTSCIRGRDKRTRCRARARRFAQGSRGVSSTWYNIWPDHGVRCTASEKSERGERQYCQCLARIHVHDSLRDNWRYPRILSSSGGNSPMDVFKINIVHATLFG